MSNYKRLTVMVTVAALACTIAGPAAAQHRRGRHRRHASPPAGSPAGTTQAPGQPAPADSTVAEARREYSQGQQQIESQPEQALGHFQRAYTLRPNPVVLLPIAEAQQRLGQISDAIATLERYLHDRPDAPDRVAVQQRLSQLSTRPATVHVVSDPPGGRIVIDGRDTGQITPSDVPAEPGHRAFRIDLTGHRSYSQGIETTPGGHADIRAQLVPVEAARTLTTASVTERPTASPLTISTTGSHAASPWVWVAGGLTAAGLIAGSVFGFMALSDLSDYNTNPSLSTKDRGETNAILSDVSFATAVLSGITAVIVYASDHTREGSGPQQHAYHRGPRFRPAPNGLTVHF